MSAKKYLSYTNEALYILSSFLARPIKLSFIIGSKAAFFSVSQCFLSTIGFFANPRITLLSFILRSIYELLFIGAGFFVSSVYHIPTFCGAFYLSTQSRILKLLLPSVCIALFVTHPIGSHAWPYTLYWLIPLVLAVSSTRSIFLQSLGGTLTSHAVGSVLWLYTHTLEAATWQALIGVVWAERLLFALGMTILYYVIVYTTESIALLTKKYNYGRNISQGSALEFKK